MTTSFITEARQKACREARRALRHDFVVFDTETTGLDNREDRIVAIGVVDSEGNALLDTLINPEIPIPWDATHIHGITDDMVVNAPTFAEVYPVIYAALEGRCWVGYNLSFDRGFLFQECERRNLLKPPQALLSWREENDLEYLRWHEFNTDDFDLMHIYAMFYGQYSDYHASFTWQKLVNACRDLGIQRGRAHHALDDALSTLALVRRLAEFE